MSDSLGAVLEDPGDAAALLEPLVRDADRVQLDQLRPGSPLLSVPLPSAEDHVEPATATLVLPLGATGGISAGLLASVRAAERHAPGLSFEHATLDNLDELVAALFQLHRARWNGRGVLQGLDAFHAEVARGMLRAGLLRMHAVRIAGRVAAVLYGFSSGGRASYYLSGFDPAFAKYSPGSMAILHAIDEARAEACTDFDFLRGAEPYKLRWGAREVPAFRRTALLHSIAHVGS